MDLLKRINLKYKEIEELEEEIKNYEFGSAPYDDVNADLECLYVTVSRMEREYNEIY
tara:strand:- start:3533 stop:3703 length:171 start_codon:yes stop_codon:yes gene_type:complete